MERSLHSMVSSSMSSPLKPKSVFKACADSTGVCAVIWQAYRLCMVVSVSHSLPKLEVSRTKSCSGQKTFKKPKRPSKAECGPVKPFCAKLEERMPACAARPMCKRLTMAPLPAMANSSSPPAQDAASPIAFAVRFSSRPISLAQPAADPKGPVVPGA